MRLCSMPIDFRVPPNDGDWGPHTREVKVPAVRFVMGALPSISDRIHPGSWIGE